MGNAIRALAAEIEGAGKVAHAGGESQGSAEVARAADRAGADAHGLADDRGMVHPFAGAIAGEVDTTGFDGGAVQVRYEILLAEVEALGHPGSEAIRASAKTLLAENL